MKNIILFILVMFSFVTKAETSNHEYIFKVKKNSFIVQSIDNENPTNNQDCQAKEVNWLNCSTQSTLLTHGQSIEIINTVEDYEGAVTISCSDGVLSQINPICEEKNKDCQSQEVNWLNCSSQSTLLTHGQSIEISNTLEEYEGTVTVSCSNGVLSQVNLVCEEKITFNCDDPINVGQRGTGGECEGLLIVDNASIRTMVANNEDYSSNNIYTGQVTSFSSLFRNKSVNFDITGWNTSSVNNMSYMFNNSTFNQNINNWNVSNVTNMSNMFQQASSFNQPLNNWNTSSLNNIDYMFSFNNSFNQNINNWNVSNVTSMLGVFANARNFNQPLNNWNTSNVTNMGSMFYRATIFNQNISNWNVTNVSAYTYFKTYTALTDENTPSKFLN